MSSYTAPMFEKTTAIILAAGRSTRMGGDAKVLAEVNGKPLIHYLLDTLRTLGVPRPIVVVGHRQEEVRSALSTYEVQFVDQGEPLGTGHAVQMAELAMAPGVERAILCYGDTPFMSATTLQTVHDKLDDPGIVCSLVTTTKTDSTERFGRIIRNDADELKAIVEYKDADDSVRAVSEVNVGGYCARLPWLWEALRQVKPSAATGEYYLTDIVKIAVAEGQRVVPVMVPPAEGHAVDSPELLDFVRSQRTRTAVAEEPLDTAPAHE
jgi:bifunctional UDP-N-acetylglucosamine pyrophosphorylase / glucosamine-1-phosphate N-acetyltransferase